MSLTRVAVIGAGTMGHGIAQVAIQSGLEVRLCDAQPLVLDRALQQIRSGLDRTVEKGRLDAAGREAALARLATARDPREASHDADLVIEAIPERLELKQALFASLEEIVPAGCLLASNTSSLRIASIAAGRRRPERILGMHFFNPVPVMALLEIVVHAGTAPGSLEQAREAGARLGKTCIVVQDSPGFASSRLGIALGLEAIRMVEQGVASPQDIDTAMELGYRHPMGPLRLTDVVGLDVRLAIAESLHRELGSEAFRPPRLLVEMVREGRLGKKSGRGFYDWSGSS
ncbi:MAG TPA: 3-hydroxyacyl-CoA dehydrogenase family protein [Candidatus Polarisedimenticolia bacterium]|jgi:3-hydroxybutyryl-CoA dehydrogenase|nr:3-hydroxyacyl-CoA dehydrogenase family protein [Candidatus Polarisedimenticolia bacterium]